MSKHILKYSVLVAMLINIATPVFAEDAPVYDVDGAESLQAEVFPNTESGVVHSQSGYVARQRSMAYANPPLTLEQRVARVERQIDALQHANVSSKVDMIQNDVQTLRGQVEQLLHQVQQLQDQQKVQYSDLDKRLSQRVPEKVPNVADQTASSANESTASTVTQSELKKPVLADAAKTKQVASNESLSSVQSDQQPNIAEEQQIYQTAYDFIKARKYNNAIAALQNMLRKYPSGQFAANAHYWLGELYGLLAKNDESAAEFATVAKNYPDSPKVPDAELKIGLIYAGQMKWNEARTAFKQVISHYPGTASARVASEQLKQIKIAGH